VAVEAPLKKTTGNLGCAEGAAQRRHGGRPSSWAQVDTQVPEEIGEGLEAQRFKASHETVRRLLNQLGYSLRVNRQHLSRRQDAQRDRQRRYLARKRREFLKAKKPAISVDTKKKELVGNFKNAGRTWRQEALAVLTTDFLTDAEGKAIPYGVYDMARNRGFVGVGISHETAEFAVNVIQAWWWQEGQAAYAGQTELLIQADGGGANGYRSWLWKWELQQFADETGLTITVTHYPTRASKWNWIEQRLFAPISQNWAGQPRVSYETILKYIRATKTENGLQCRAYLDKTFYETRKKITPEQKESINLFPHRVLSQWNYTIKPRITSGKK
jgi:hypothetical protein